MNKHSSSVLNSYSYTRELKANISEIYKILNNSNFLKLILLFSSNQFHLDFNNKPLFKKAINNFTKAFYKKSDITVEGKEVFANLEDLEIDNFFKFNQNNKDQLVINDSCFYVKDKGNEYHDFNEYYTTNTHTNNDYKNALTLSDDEELYFKLDSFEKSYKHIKSKIICYSKKSNKEEFKSKLKLKNNNNVGNFLKSKDEKNFLITNNSNSFFSDLNDQTYKNDKNKFEWKEIDNDNLLLFGSDSEFTNFYFTFDISIYYYCSNRSILLIKVIDFSLKNTESSDKSNQLLSNLNFSLLDQIINSTQYVTNVVNEESIIINSYKQKIFDFISNFNNIKILNPGLTSFEILDKVLNKLTIRLDNKFQYEIEIKESKTPSSNTREVFSEDWILKYFSKNFKSTSENHEVVYTVKTLSKKFCMIKLKFTFLNPISNEIFKEIKLQQINNLISIKKILEES
jgi:hypothetical protein